MGIVLYGILLAHLEGYKHYYTNIGITFAMTVVMKKLVKSTGNTDNADLVGLGGYTLTIGEFVKLLGKIAKGGFIEGKGIAGTNDTGNGLIGDLIKSITDSLTTKN